MEEKEKQNKTYSVLVRVSQIAASSILAAARAKRPKKRRLKNIDHERASKKIERANEPRQNLEVLIPTTEEKASALGRQSKGPCAHVRVAKFKQHNEGGNPGYKKGAANRTASRGYCRWASVVPALLSTQWCQKMRALHGGSEPKTKRLTKALQRSLNG